MHACEKRRRARAPSCSAGVACAARTRFSACAKNSAVKAGRLAATMLSHSWLPASRKLRPQQQQVLLSEA